MFKDIKAIRGKFYIKRLIEEGEHEKQDFKFQISDVHKIAHSISAFANRGGGHLLVGVKDNGTIAGLRSEEDLYLLEAAAEVYCRPAVQLEMTTFACEGGAVVLRAVIPQAVRRPVRCKEADGHWQAYYRVADENIVAHPLMVRAWEKESRDANDGRTVLRTSEGEGVILRLLDENGPTEIDEILLRSRLPRATAEDAVVRLASMHLVAFVHAGSSFRLKLL